MCTVSYIPLSVGKFLLTSNRDEKIARPTDLPKAEKMGDQEIFFPKDKKAGGTWIAASDSGRVCCLLNGAFKNHTRKANYIKSRGQVLLEAFKHKNIHNFFELVSLENVEPFTLIISDFNENHNLFEFRWDEKEKHVKVLKTDKPQIWSSSTLYSKEIQNRRAHSFKDLLEKQSQPDRESILNFHSFTDQNNPDNNIVIKRENGLQTVSITQIMFNNNCFSMHYYDLVNEEQSAISKSIKRKTYA